MASLVTIFTLAIALPFAYFLVRYVSRRWQRVILLAVIVPFWTSYLLRVYAWQAILGENGALNQLLMGLHLIDKPSTLFVYNDPAVFLVLVYVYFPFAVLALYASLEKFDFTQLNAAQDLGARPDQAFRHILLPQIRAGVITACDLRVRADPRRVPDPDRSSAAPRARSSPTSSSTSSVAPCSPRGPPWPSSSPRSWSS